jgi:hypothetical protein
MVPPVLVVTVPAVPVASVPAVPVVSVPAVPVVSVPAVPVVSVLSALAVPGVCMPPRNAERVADHGHGFPGAACQLDPQRYPVAEIGFAELVGAAVGVLDPLSVA